MANITLTTSGNSHIDLADPTMPKYVGARAKVTRTANSVIIWMKDYKGETQETIAEAIQSITSNADGSLTFTLPDGRQITTESLTGPQGEQGIQGERGIGIASIEKTGTSGLVDTYTITFDDEDTETFTVTNGQKGDKGDTGNTGPQGVQGEKGETGDTGNGIESIEKTATAGLVDTYTITFTNGSTTTFTVTNGASGSGSVADVWVDGVSVLDGDTAKIDMTGKANVSDLATVATSGDYDDLLDKPTIPEKVSDLTNDTGFITSPNVVYCTCSTADSTAQKVATIVSGSLNSLHEGDQAIVKFAKANAASNPTLKIGSLEAKSIKRYGTTAPSTSAKTSWNEGSCISFVYDGSNWQMCGWLNNDTTYSSMSSSEAHTGTGTSARTITAARLKDAILYHETGEPNVQSDWNESDTSSDAYIQNKPTIPTVPTNVSAFTNDAGYLTAETDPVFSASASAGISSSDISAWNNKSDFSGSYNDLTNKPVDHVVLQGGRAETMVGDGYWRWREWSSGKVEIWYRGSMSLSSQSTVGTLYRNMRRVGFPNYYRLYKAMCIVDGTAGGAWLNCGGIFNINEVNAEPYAMLEIMAYKIGAYPEANYSNVNIYICGEKNA